MKKETAVSKYGISVKEILKRTVIVYNKFFAFFNLHKLYLLLVYL